MDLERTVRWLRDRELIKELPQRYAHGLDTRDFEESRSVFHDDCNFKGALGESHIDTYFPALITGVQAYEATMHFMGNQYVRLDEGADEGTIETYAVAYHMEAADSGRKDLVMGVRYIDSVARDGEGWQIVRRTAVPHWVRGPLPRPA